MRRRLIIVAAVGAVVLMAAGGYAESGGAKSTGEGSSEQTDEVDHVALGATLVRDGHYDRAETELSKVDPSAEGVDRPLYYTLRGLVALHSGANETAVEHFGDAIRYGQTSDRIFVHLAQAYYGLRNWKKVIQSVRNAEDTGRKIPDLYLMKAEAQRKLGRRAAAWKTLRAGADRFPDRSEFARQQVFLLVEMGLYQTALRQGQTYLQQTEKVGAEDYVAVAEAFRRAGEHRRAQILLEEARAKYRGNVDVLVHLAHAYIGTDELVAAGELMQIAAESDAKYVQKSAELFRRAGAYERALFMNSRIADQRTKFKQRVAILVDRRSYEKLASLTPRLSRLGLLEEANVAYALAYAHFKIRDYERAADLTRGIESKETFEAAVELRRAIQKCKKRPWKC